MFLAIALYLGGDSQAIRADIAAIRADLTSVRAEMAANNQAIRAEMAEEFKAVRAEIANSNERLARVGTRLDSMGDRIYMDSARPPM